MNAERWHGAARPQSWSSLAVFTTRSGPGLERRVTEQTVSAVQGLGLSAECLGRLKLAISAAVASATLPASGSPAASHIVMRVLVSPPAGCPSTRGAGQECVRGAPRHISDTSMMPAEPNHQPPLRSWGFFLVRRTGAPRDLEPGGSGSGPTIELFLYC